MLFLLIVLIIALALHGIGVQTAADGKQIASANSMQIREIGVNHLRYKVILYYTDGGSVTISV